MKDIVYNEDCLEGLKKLPDNCIDCCVTSPPYYGLRDYGNSEQIGLEQTPEIYVQKLVDVFEQVRRVLKKEGTLWLNLGDSYSGSGARSSNPGGETEKQSTNAGSFVGGSGAVVPKGMKPKDLIGIPWMVAFALRSAGWYLRQDIIWHKPNPMPESVTDRCTKAHEYIFLLSKSANYYYDQDAIKTEISDTTIKRLMQNLEFQKGSDRVPGKTNGAMKAVGEFRKGYSHRGPGDKKLSGHTGNLDIDGNVIGGGLANKKSVWTVTTRPYSEAHFATFPERLIVDCIKAGCPEFVCNKCGKAREKIIEKEYINHENWYGDKTKETKHSRGKAGNSYNELVGTKQTGLTGCDCNEGFSPGIVLDPFMGAFTTALVAKKLHRHYVGFELNPEYIKIGKRRLQKELGMFNS